MQGCSSFLSFRTQKRRTSRIFSCTLPGRSSVLNRRRAELSQKVDWLKIRQEYSCRECSLIAFHTWQQILQ